MGEGAKRVTTGRLMGAAHGPQRNRDNHNRPALVHGAGRVSLYGGEVKGAPVARGMGFWPLDCGLAAGGPQAAPAVGAGLRPGSKARRLRAIAYRVSAWRERETAARRPFLWIPVAMIAGIVLYFSLPQEPDPAPFLALCVFAALVAALSAGVPLLRGLTTGIAAAAAGLVLASWRTADVAAPVLERPVYGVVSVALRRPRRAQGEGGSCFASRRSHPSRRTGRPFG